MDYHPKLNLLLCTGLSTPGERARVCRPQASLLAADQWPWRAQGRGAQPAAHRPACMWASGSLRLLAVRGGAVRLGPRPAPRIRLLRAALPSSFYSQRCSAARSCPFVLRSATKANAHSLTPGPAPAAAPPLVVQATSLPSWRPSSPLSPTASSSAASSCAPATHKSPACGCAGGRGRAVGGGHGASGSWCGWARGAVMHMPLFF